MGERSRIMIIYRVLCLCFPVSPLHFGGIYHYTTTARFALSVVRPANVRAADLPGDEKKTPARSRFRVGACL